MNDGLWSLLSSSLSPLQSPEKNTEAMCWNSKIFPLLFLLSRYGDVAVSHDAIDPMTPCSCCRSNETHIAWKTTPPARSVRDTKSRRLSLPCCTWQTHDEAQQDAYHYLRRNVLSFDAPFLETMGFDDNEAPPDGLGAGLIGPVIKNALQAKVLYPYTDELPRSIWQEYVLNYAHLNEGRSNWRPYLFNQLSPLLLRAPSPRHLNISSVVHTINRNMWKVLSPSQSDSIVFVAGSTPLIFDPMSVLVFGYASCTGLAILLASALRSVGVPCRVAGTPAWYNHHAARGNHDWVEVWKENQWYFLEPTVPASGSIGSSDDDDDNVDDLDRDPCQRWFCNSHFQYGHGPNQTRVYAARLETTEKNDDDGDAVFFRLAWEWGNHAIPADDRTAYYQATCNHCDDA